MMFVPAGTDPSADPADFEDPAYDDADEGADDKQRPITSLGGSERLIYFWLNRRRGI